MLVSPPCVSVRFLQVDKLLAMYAGEERDLWAHIRDRYPDADIPTAAEVNAAVEAGEANGGDLEVPIRTHTRTRGTAPVGYRM